MTQSKTKQSLCPYCGGDHLYQLGDGRYKCRACQRKFSPTGRRSRLSTDAMEAIISGFAAGDPTSKVAAEAGLNLKTVQLYYGRIRELLAKDREEYLADCYGSAQVSADFFTDSELRGQWRNAEFIGCLIAQDTEMELLFVNEADTENSASLDSAAVAGWLVAADRRAMEDPQLDRIFCLAGKNRKERARTFWINAKRRLSAYCGGFKKHFRLYLREMEFRNNMESTAAAREHIGELLDQTTITPTGEEDA